MDVTRTTPPRPLDVAAAFPELAPLARPATRLHPRPGPPSPRDSSVGGPLLWPADEPWPHCDGPHTVSGGREVVSLADVRLGRRIHAAAAGRNLTPQERETLGRIHPRTTFPLAPEQPYPGPVAMLPVAQLHLRDVPGVPAPAGKDLLQVLWCPFDHPPTAFMPRTALFWRSAASVTDVLGAPPEPAEVQSRYYVPEPCLLAPEQITEYPCPPELSREQRELLGNEAAWQAAGVDPHSLDDDDGGGPEDFYRNNLSVAPGWKAGGWAPWGFNDPVSRFCPACDTRLVPLLTIATFEWDHGTRGWIPDEVPAPAGPPRAEPSRTAPSPAPAGPTAQQIADHFRAQGIEVHQRGFVPASVREGRGRVPRGGSPAPSPAPAEPTVPREPTGVTIGRGYDQQLYVCPASPEHPHAEYMQ